MQYCNSTDVSEAIDVNQTSTSNECITCHYWYFLDKAFKFQSSICNSCYDVLMMSIDINSIAILNDHGVDYYRIIIGISNREAINVLRNVDLSENSGSL